MGAKPSKHRVKCSSVVKIVLGGGHRETYSRPVSAQEVMLRHPQHVLTHLDVKDPEFRKSIVTAETVLLPGNKYFLVRRRTVEWLLDQHLPGHLSGSIDSPSGHAMEIIESPKHLDCSLSEILRLHPKHSIIPSPQRFADEQIDSDKGGGKSPRSPWRLSPISPLRPWRSSPKVSPGVEQKFADEQIDSDKGGGKSPRSPWHLSPISPLRSRRSSPKVSPGVDFALWYDQLTDGCLSSISQAGAAKDGESEKIMDVSGKVYSSPPKDECQINGSNEERRKGYHASGLLENRKALLQTSSHIQLTSHFPLLCVNQTSGGLGEKHGQGFAHKVVLDGCLPMHSMSSVEEDTVALKQSSNSELSSNVEILLQREANIPLEEKPQKKSLSELLKCPDQQPCILTGAQETDELVVVDISVQEAFKFNDFHTGFLFEDKAMGDALPVKATGNGVINTDKEQMPSLTVESVELHIDPPVVESDIIPCLQQENVQHNILQPCLSTHIVTLEDADENLAGELHQGYQLYCHVEGSKGSPVNAGPQSRVSASLQENGATFPSQSPLPSILADDLSEDEQREGCRDTCSKRLIQDRLKKGCADTFIEVLCEEQTSNPVIFPVVRFSKETGMKCPSVEEETALPDCALKAVSVDNLSDNISSKELNPQPVQTLRDIFLRRSPNYLELIDAGFKCNLMPSVSVAPSSPASAPLSCLLPSSSSFLVSPSSVPLSTKSSSKAFPPSPSSSSLLLPSSPGMSLSLLMDFNAPMMKRSDPFQSSSKQQENLHLLGFNSIRGNTLSIHDQAKAHARADRFIMGKPSKLSTISKKQEIPPSEEGKGVQGKEQEAWRPSTSQYHGSPLILSPRSIRKVLWKPRKRMLLSPIPEFSPEQSPASLSS
ncbi:hypothetical protein GOP47_0000310 [Adiantum capillus-veneris]|uniref:Uncharacterized protein n=1 Tax=Adiantum capillus-veneris TaxID=13818 RepID=A0A9D4VEH4_ADICA|nr:hypothetical protein GOP47_0000310 [Adiantum capillus-veneris]